MIRQKAMVLINPSALLTFIRRRRQYEVYSSTSKPMGTPWMTKWEDDRKKLKDTYKPLTTLT